MALLNLLRMQVFATVTFNSSALHFSSLIPPCKQWPQLRHRSSSTCALGCVFDFYGFLQSFFFLYVCVSDYGVWIGHYPCVGRNGQQRMQAEDGRPLLPAASKQPAGSLTTSFTKLIPQWDENGRHQHYSMKERDKG